MRERSVIPQLRRGTIEAFVLRTVGVGLLFLMHSFIGRLIGPKNYGTFSYTLALAGLLSVVVPLGWPTALMRFIVEYREKQKWGLLHGALIRASQMTLVFSIVCGLTLRGFASGQSISPHLATSFRFAALLLPLLAFASLRRKAFQGLQQAKNSIILEEVALPLLTLSCLIAFPVATASEVLLMYASAALIVCLVSSIRLLSSLPEQGRTAVPEFQTRFWLTIALPMVFGQVSQTLLNRTDVLMLGAMTEMGEVGLYSAANRIATLNTFVLGVVNTVATPRLAAAYHGGRLQQLKAIRSWMIKWSACSALPMVMIMMIWPQGLLNLFGSEFTQGKLLLQVLALGQFVNAATGPVGFTLLMTGKERSFAVSMAVVASFNIVGNLFLIPKFGSLGAAFVTAISVALLNGWQFWLTKCVV